MRLLQHTEMGNPGGAYRAACLVDYCAGSVCIFGAIRASAGDIVSTSRPENFGHLCLATDADLALVDADVFDYIEDAVDYLLDIRQRVAIPLVLLTSSSRHDDFSTSRAAICDATLASPMSGTRLRAAIENAMLNYDSARSRDRKVF